MATSAYILWAFDCTVMGGVHLFLVIPRLIDKDRVLRRGSGEYMCDISTFPICTGPLSGRSGSVSGILSMACVEAILCPSFVTVTTPPQAPALQSIYAVPGHHLLRATPYTYTQSQTFSLT